MSSFYGKMPDGTEVKKICLKNGSISADVITYGGTLTSLKVKDRNGQPTEVLLGFDSLEGYLTQDKFLCALVGRYANRIGNARFSLNGKEYLLEKNDGRNHLHGGSDGFYAKVWDILFESDTEAVLGLTSPDMEGGYPGRLDVTVRYKLDGPALRIDYEAVSDADTLCNLTSHGYFNLSGDLNRSIEDDFIRIFADRYTPTDAESIPTGEIAPVEGTPMDLRSMTKIGLHIDDDFEQLKFAGGYDHNFVINEPPAPPCAIPARPSGSDGSKFPFETLCGGVARNPSDVTGVLSPLKPAEQVMPCGFKASDEKLRPAAEAYSEHSGIFMRFETDRPGMQFYTGNYLETAFGKRTAFCLESQAFPDSPNKPDFPSCVLRKGEKYVHRAVFSFSTL